MRRLPRLARSFAPAALALVAVACAPDFRPAARHLGRTLPETPEREPVHERRRIFFDAEHTRVRREWNVLILADSSTVADGRDAQYYPDGKLEYEREYARGEPVGLWRSWWPNGAPRMEATYGTQEPQPMRWWHENGQLSSEGFARNGIKEGPWAFWHANGVKSAEGVYAGGRRDATWRYWDEAGEPVRRDVRAGGGG
jgi:hypothetical protein